MAAQLVGAVVVVSPDGRVLDRTVHALDLTVPRESDLPDRFLILGPPGMVGLCQPMLDAICLADHVEPHEPRDDGVLIARLLCELDTVVGEDRVDAVGHSFEEQFRELPCGLSVRPLDQLRYGELARSVNGDEERQLALGCPELGDVPSRACKHGLPGSECGRTRWDTA